MAKFYGKIGFGKATEVETKPGVWVVKPTEVEAYGDVLRNSYRNKSEDRINTGIRLNNIISVVMDPFLSENYQNIKYITFMGTKWKPETVTVKYPRLEITLGEVYNEND